MAHNKTVLNFSDVNWTMHICMENNIWQYILLASHLSIPEVEMKLSIQSLLPGFHLNLATSTFKKHTVYTKFYVNMPKHVESDLDLNSLTIMEFLK